MNEFQKNKKRLGTRPVVATWLKCHRSWPRTRPESGSCLDFLPNQPAGSSRNGHHLLLLVFLIAARTDDDRFSTSDERICSPGGLMFRRFFLFLYFYQLSDWTGSHWLRPPNLVGTFTSQFKYPSFVSCLPTTIYRQCWYINNCFRSFSLFCTLLGRMTICCIGQTAARFVSLAWMPWLDAIGISRLHRKTQQMLRIFYSVRYR